MILIVSVQLLQKPLRTIIPLHLFCFHLLFLRQDLLPSLAAILDQLPLGLENVLASFMARLIDHSRDHKLRNLGREVLLSILQNLAVDKVPYTLVESEIHGVVCLSLCVIGPEFAASSPLLYEMLHSGMHALLGQINRGIRARAPVCLLTGSLKLRYTPGLLSSSPAAVSSIPT